MQTFITRTLFLILSLCLICQSIKAQEVYEECLTSGPKMVCKYYDYDIRQNKISSDSLKNIETRFEAISRKLSLTKDDKIKIFKKGYAIVGEYKNYTIWDLNGHRLFDEVFNVVRNDYDSDAWVVENKKGKEGLVNPIGPSLKVFECVCNSVSQIKRNLFKIEKDSLQGVVNEKGEFVIPMEYTELAYIGFDKDLKASYRAKKNGKYGYIDSLNNVVFPIIYTYLDWFRNGFAMAKIDKAGIINMKGEWVLITDFDHIGRFEGMSPKGNRFYYVKKENKYGVIDSLGNIVVSAIYDNFQLSGDVMKLEKDRKVGFFSFESGKMVCEPKYDIIGRFRNGFAPVMLAKKKGFVSSTGKELIEPIYWGVYQYDDEIVLEKEQGSKKIRYKYDAHKDEFVRKKQN